MIGSAKRRQARRERSSRRVRAVGRTRSTRLGEACSTRIGWATPIDRDWRHPAAARRGTARWRGRSTYPAHAVALGDLVTQVEHVDIRTSAGSRSSRRGDRTGRRGRPNRCARHGARRGVHTAVTATAASGRCRMSCKETNCTRHDGDHHLFRHHRFSDAEPHCEFKPDVAAWFLHNLANSGSARSSDRYTDLTFRLVNYAPGPNSSNGIANLLPAELVCWTCVADARRCAVCCANPTRQPSQAETSHHRVSSDGP
jgi:hypothetical protein